MLALLRTFSWQELRQHPWRTATALVAIMLGVALGFAVHVINQSALDEFSRAVRTVNGQPDLELRAMQGALPEALYGQVAQQPQVGLAAPWIEATALATGTGQATAPIQLRVLGGDALRLASVAPALMPRLFEGGGRLDLFAPDAVFLNAAALEALGLTPGQARQAPLPWQLAGRMQTLRIAGTVAASGPPLAVMDIGALQDSLGRWGQVDRIDVLLAEGATRESLLAGLRRLPDWPAQALASRPGDDQQRIAEMSRAYRVNLTVLALVALFTGAFLVFSVLALSVAQRAPQFALLAVLGLTPRQRLGLVLIESLLLGIAGSAAGIALGAGLAWLALHLLGGDLGGGYFAGVQPALQWSAGAALTFGLLGVAATVAGGWWPARQAMELPPAATLKGQGAGGERAARGLPALLLIAASVALAFLPPVGGIPLAAYAAVALLLLGGMAALPWLLGQWLRLVPRSLLGRPLALLPVERARRMRRSTTVAVGGVVASLSLAVALTVMVASFRDSMVAWLDAVLPAPLYLRMAGGAGRADAAQLPTDLAARIAALPGVQRAQPMRSTSLWLNPERPAVSLLLRPLHGPQGQQLPWVQGPVPVPPGDTAVYVSEAVAQLYGVRTGQAWPLLAQALQADSDRIVVAGIWRDYVRQYGAIAMDWEDYGALATEGPTTPGPTEIAIWPLHDGPDAVQQLRPRIEALMAVPGAARALEFASSGALRERSLRIFDRSFAVTYWLQAVAIAIGLFGIAASFSAQVLARRKEFGLLAHLGLRRRDILAVVAGEGMAWTLAGAIAGTLLGLGVAVILVHVVNPQSFHWTMELSLPWPRLAALAASVVAAGTLTAWLAGRAAAGRSAVLAVKEDW
ncbi:outer membrane-specific lipoprotein transporter subunit LolE [Delftia tsuruhatensis]|uniref:ABC transporter permease n=1 Tax=Delftia tsuruhatensis TaxID=180282 RepID=UPI001E817627|nr:ABC transporter permease [Delftia tsuruhatensis]CAB5657236.1 outer membrane-specific lipoprotein transporter subunit LolE [Delftia tsuruhatensis]CAC9679150.1 outer membrane-specific lipoprotein transporter subunit LolE [Delftia tsuruhatensis]